MGELIQALVGLGLCAGVIWLLIWSHRSSKALADNLIIRVAAMDGDGTPSPMEKIAVFVPMIGGPGRRKSTVYVGLNYLFMYVPMAGQPDFVQIAWHDVLDVALTEPDLPQLAPTDVAAVLANATTRAQYGKDVVVTIYENGREDDLVFGGLLGRAAEMAELIRQRIHAS